MIMIVQTDFSLPTRLPIHSNHAVQAELFLRAVTTILSRYGILKRSKVVARMCGRWYLVITKVTGILTRLSLTHTNRRPSLIPFPAINIVRVARTIIYHTSRQSLKALTRDNISS